MQYDQQDTKINNAHTLELKIICFLKTFTSDGYSIENLGHGIDIN